MVKILPMNSEAIFKKFGLLKRYLNWSAPDDTTVTQLRKVLMPFSQVLVEDFYREIVRHPEIFRVI
ncbi:MAG TPA: hypothetical protein PKA06_13175, partial [Gemmatales bacterium]|nr:hypothetical protein [Gemmatales bacterium]